MMASVPIWFFDKEATAVRELLHWFVRQLDKTPAAERAKALSRKLNAANCAQLFDYTDLDTRTFLWGCLVELSQAPYGLWHGVSGALLNDELPSGPITLVFNVDAEAQLRLWLNTPSPEAEASAWWQQVEAAKLSLNQDLLRQLGNPGGLTADEMIAGLRKLLLAPPERCTWRQLAAGYFSGDSKFFESQGRREWLLALMPHIEARLVSRPLLLCAHVVPNARGILVVENQDSFCWLASLCDQGVMPEPLHVVYGQGYSSSALRVTQASALRFSYTGDFSQAPTFERAWFSPEASVPVYFWGDLDYSGMGILQALRRAFPMIDAWQPGFAPMVHALLQGYGHSPAVAGKENQRHPGLTGCSYADAVLLPLLESKQRFLDQEWLQANDLLPL